MKELDKIRKSLEHYEKNPEALAEKAADLPGILPDKLCKAVKETVAEKGFLPKVSDTTVLLSKVRMAMGGFVVYNRCTIIIFLDSLDLVCTSILAIDCKIILITASEDVSSFWSRMYWADKCSNLRFMFDDCFIYDSTAVVVNENVELAYKSFFISWKEVVKTFRSTIFASEKKGRVVSWKTRDYIFSNSSFVAGIEIELPVDTDDYKETAQDVGVNFSKRVFYFDSDSSQADGDLEIILTPKKVDYYFTGDFERQLDKIYYVLSLMDNYPEDGVFYKSGIHIHFSWDSSIDVTSEEFYKEQYYILGSEEKIKELTGKKNLVQYSQYPTTCKMPVDRYYFVHIVSKNHVEMRWGRSHADPKDSLDVIRTMLITAYLTMYRIYFKRWYKIQLVNQVIWAAQRKLKQQQSNKLTHHNNKRKQIKQ